MAKELPYFKFEPAEWQNGDIQICSDQAKLCFINICCSYWIKAGDLSIRFSIIKCCNSNEECFTELVDSGLVKIDGDNISISFLDNQLDEFKNISKARSESGKKGGTNRSLRPENERKKGNQLYFLLCSNENEQFIKMGVTSESLSRRFSGKIPYDYSVISQIFSDNYIELESTYGELLKKFEYVPKEKFNGSNECYSIDSYEFISKILNKNHGIAIASQLRRNAIREEEKREEEKREEEKPKIKKKVWAIPDIDEFVNYYETALQTDFPNRHFAVRNKYQAWVENDWKDGNNRSIKNWKTKLGATIQYLPEQKTNQNGAGQKSNIDAIADWVYGSRSPENTDDTERIE